MFHAISSKLNESGLPKFSGRWICIPLLAFLDILLFVLNFFNDNDGLLYVNTIPLLSFVPDYLSYDPRTSMMTTTKLAVHQQSDSGTWVRKWKIRVRQPDAEVPRYDPLLRWPRTRDFWRWRRIWRWNWSVLGERQLWSRWRYWYWWCRFNNWWWDWENCSARLPDLSLAVMVEDDEDLDWNAIYQFFTTWQTF